MTAPMPGCASSPNRLGTSPWPPQSPSSILHFYFFQSPKIKPFLFASYPRALQPSLVEKLGLLQPFAQSGGRGSAPPTCPSPPEVSLPLLVRGLQAIPHPHTSPWSLSSQPSRSGAQLTQRREGQGGRGKEVVGGSRVGTASGRAGHGLPWQPQIARQLAGGGGGRVGGREGSKLGTAPRESFFNTLPDLSPVSWKTSKLTHAPSHNPGALLAAAPSLPAGSGQLLTAYTPADRSL